MNYEEMLRTQDMGHSPREELSLGVFCKKLLDKKYRNVVQLKTELTENLAFCDGLKNDQQTGSGINHVGQMHYELHADSGGYYELELESGNILTLAQLIDTSPAVVTKPGFIDDVIRTLLDFTCLLHDRSIYQLCYSPQEIFLRKGEQTPMLLCHGSSFGSRTNFAELYKGYEQFVAPEVLTDHKMGEAQDVYALGRFIEWLFQNGDLPYEYKAVVKKATQDVPENRYASVADMKHDLEKKRNLKRSLFTFVAAVAAVLLCIFLYFELVPQSANIEFVEGAQKQQEADADFSEEGFNPETELGLWDEVDSTLADDTLSVSERAQMDAYMRKAEDIFRKQYQREADRIISKVYSKEGMSLSENVFVAATNTMTDELKEAEQRLAGDAGISDEKAVRIAAEINEQLARDKQRNLNTKSGTHGVLHPKNITTE